MKTLLGTIVMLVLIFGAVAVCGIIVNIMQQHLLLFIPLVAIIIKLIIKELNGTK